MKPKHTYSLFWDPYRTISNLLCVGISQSSLPSSQRWEVSAEHLKKLADIIFSIGKKIHVLALCFVLAPEIKPSFALIYFVRNFIIHFSSQFCCSAGGAAGYQAVISSILPVVAIALEDEKPEVRVIALIIYTEEL